MPGPRSSRKINFAEKLRAAHVRPLQGGGVLAVHLPRKSAGRDKSLPLRYIRLKNRKNNLANGRIICYDYKLKTCSVPQGAAQFYKGSLFDE